MWPVAKLRVLDSLASDPIGWITSGIQSDFRVKRFPQVDVKHVCETEQIGKDVGEFLTDPGRPRRVIHHRSCLTVGEPLEDLCKLASLTHQGEEEVPGIVVLLPVSLLNELA